MTEKVLYIGTWSMSYKFLVDFKFVREDNFLSLKICIILDPRFQMMSPGSLKIPQKGTFSR